MEKKKENQTQNFIKDEITNVINKFIDEPEKQKECQNYLEIIINDEKALSIIHRLSKFRERINNSPPLDLQKANDKIASYNKLFEKIDELRHHNLPDSYRASRKLIFNLFPEESRWPTIFSFEYDYFAEELYLIKKTNPFFKILKALHSLG